MNESIGYRIQKEFNSDKKVTIFDTITLSLEGRFTANLLEKWGMVAAKMNGEDSSGRARMALLTPEEVVNRAFEVTALFFKQAKGLGFLINLPDLNSINVMEETKIVEKEKVT